MRIYMERAENMDSFNVEGISETEKKMVVKMRSSYVLGVSGQIYEGFRARRNHVSMIVGNCGTKSEKP